MKFISARDMSWCRASACTRLRFSEIVVVHHLGRQWFCLRVCDALQCMIELVCPTRYALCVGKLQQSTWIVLVQKRLYFSLLLSCLFRTALTYAPPPENIGGTWLHWGCQIPKRPRIRASKLSPRVCQKPERGIAGYGLKTAYSRLYSSSYAGSGTVSMQQSVQTDTQYSNASEILGQTGRRRSAVSPSKSPTNFTSVNHVSHHLIP